MDNRRMAQIIATSILVAFCARTTVGQTDDANSVLLTRPLIIEGNDAVGVVDTGSSNVVLDEEYAAKWLSRHRWKPSETNAFQGRTVSREFLDVQMQLPGHQRQQADLASMPGFDQLRQIVRSDVNCIIGMSLLKSHVLQFSDGTLTLDPKVPANDSHIEHPLLINKAGLFRCIASIENLPQMECIIDTGLDTGLALDPPTIRHLITVGDAFPIPREKGIPDHIPKELIIREIKFWGTTFRNVPAVQGPENMIGLWILRRMNLIIDFPGYRILVPDPPQPGLDLFPIDASGIRFARNTGRGVRVRRIVTNSPAEKSGVQVGDVISRLDGMGSEQLTAMMLWETLSQAGKTVVLEIDRDGQRQKISVPLSHPFEYPPKWPPRKAPSQDQLDFEKFLDEQKQKSSDN